MLIPTAVKISKTVGGGRATLTDRALAILLRVLSGEVGFCMRCHLAANGEADYPSPLF